MTVTQETIRQAQKGDIGAFEAIYRSHFSFVAAVACRVVRTRDDAQEVVQNVFLKIHQNLHRFRGESSLKTWIYRITINQAINYARKEARHRNTVEFDERCAGKTPAPPALLSEDEGEARNQMMRLLDVLSPGQKACIVLRSVEGLSYADIARVLKIPVNTVRTRIKRAREKMLAVKSEVMNDDDM